MKRQNDGLLAFNDGSLWKHTVPLQPLSLPSAAPSGRVMLLVTVRDVMSWLVSMANKSYEVYLCRNHRRKQDDLRWLLCIVTLQADELWRRNAFGPQQFSTVVDLWAANGAASRVFIER